MLMLPRTGARRLRSSIGSYLEPDPRKNMQKVRDVRFGVNKESDRGVAAFPTKICMGRAVVPEEMFLLSPGWLFYRIQPLLYRILQIHPVDVAQFRYRSFKTRLYQQRNKFAQPAARV